MLFRSVVVIPCFNGERFLSESIRSILCQTPLPDRVYVIDDGSTDRSRAIIESHSRTSSIVVGIYYQENRGKAAVLNQILDELNAEYVLIQDADDVSQPNRIERQIAFMNANPEVGCSSSFIRYINETGKVIGKGQLDLLTPERLDAYLTSSEPFGLFCPAAILRCAALKDKSLRFRSRYWPADDIDLWNRIAESGWKVLAQPEYLVDYRIHGSSAVTSNFYATRLKFEYVRSSLRARRADLPEPTWEEFLTQWRSAPILRKINRWRKIHAKGLYRAAGFAWGRGQRLQASIKLLSSAMLQPFYTTKRILSQSLPKK